MEKGAKRRTCARERAVDRGVRCVWLRWKGESQSLETPLSLVRQQRARSGGTDRELRLCRRSGFQDGISSRVVLPRLTGPWRRAPSV